MKFAIKSFAVFALACFSHIAAANTIIVDNALEPSLTSVNGILDTAFGLENLQRVDDTNDQLWKASSSEVNIELVAKYVSRRLTFGYTTADDNFHALTTVRKFKPKTAIFTAADAARPFRFALDPKGKLYYTSKAGDNRRCRANGTCKGPFDQMVTWQITSGAYTGDYVVAWEKGKKQGDKDYNDLVVRISGADFTSEVPVPAATWLMMSGLLGMVGVARKS